MDDALPVQQGETMTTATADAILGDVKRRDKAGKVKRRAILDCLYELEREGTRATLTVLSDRLGWHRQTIYRHVRTLREAGLVKTEPGRYGSIALTGAGRTA